MAEDATERGRPTARWEVVALASVVVLALVAAAAAVLLGRLARSSPAASPTFAAQPSRSRRYIACIEMVGPVGTASDGGYCRRYAADVARRTELSPEQRTRLAAEARRAEEAVALPGICAEAFRYSQPGPGSPSAAGSSPAPQFPECAGLPLPARSYPPGQLRPVPGGGYVYVAPGASAPVPADADAVRVSLGKAGFPGAVSRIATADDPAPRGSIVFGVPIVDACFVGYLESARGGGSYGLQGRLPDGGCLSG